MSVPSAPPRGRYRAQADSDRRPCKDCKSIIVWIVTLGGKRMPLSAASWIDDGEGGHYASHFSDCPSAAKFRKPIEKPAGANLPVDRCEHCGHLLPAMQGIRRAMVGVVAQLDSVVKAGNELSNMMSATGLTPEQVPRARELWRMFHELASLAASRGEPKC